MRKVAILSNVTTSVLKSLIEPYCRVWSPPGYGSWVQVALAPSKELVDFCAEAVYVLFDTRFSLPEPCFDEAISSLRRHFPESAVIVPDIEKISSDLGEHFYDERMWKLSKMPWSMQGLRELSKIFKSPKVIALDLDGTLWDGVAVEDGLDNIEPKISFLNELKNLQEKGVVLTAISRNDIAAVESVFLRGNMGIELTDFSSMKIGWGEKTVAIEEISRELNISLEDFLFVDDNPVERIKMRSMQPKVTVAEFPVELSVRFPPSIKTKEDAIRNGFYIAEKERKDLSQNLSVEDYLKMLEMKACVRIAEESDIARISQLSMRSNQFNVCTTRYEEYDLKRLSKNADYRVFLVSASDRFSSLGNVGFAVVKINAQMASICDFAISCRAMNRTLEYAFIMKIIESLASENIETISSSWVQSGRNEPSKMFFDEVGFECVTSTSEVRTYICSVKEFSPGKVHYFKFSESEDV